VPAQALVLRGSRHLVFVQTAPGAFGPREVKLGYQGTTQAVVTEGLQAGERVVTENLLLLAREFRVASEEGAPPPSAAATPSPTASAP
jgi:cobalt-zinc-cadmium efflux system membrane fusion protein